MRNGYMERLRLGPALVAATAVAVLTLVMPVPVGAAAAADAPQLEWGAEGCDGTIAIIPTDEETLQPHLPEGFTPIVADEAAGILPPDPRLEAVFGIELFDCSNQTIGDEHSSDAVYASIWTFVEPPSELADPDYPFAFYKWVTLVPDGRQRAVLQRHAVPVANGGGDMGGFVFTPLAAAYDISFTIDGYGHHEIVGGGSMPADGFGGQFVEYSALERTDGYALWRTNYGAEGKHGGTGTARWGEDAFAAEVLGTSEAQAWILAVDDLSFTNGSITIQPGDRGHASARGGTPAGEGRDARRSARRADLPTTGGNLAHGGLVTGLLGLYLARR